jgi:hypothetical protein
MRNKADKMTETERRDRSDLGITVEVKGVKHTMYKSDEDKAKNLNKNYRYPDGADIHRKYVELGGHGIRVGYWGQDQINKEIQVQRQIEVFKTTKIYICMKCGRDLHNGAQHICPEVTPDPFLATPPQPPLTDFGFMQPKFKDRKGYKWEPDVSMRHKVDYTKLKMEDNVQWVRTDIGIFRNISLNYPINTDQEYPVTDYAKDKYKNVNDDVSWTDEMVIKFTNRYMAMHGVGRFSITDYDMKLLTDFKSEYR